MDKYSFILWPMAKRQRTASGYRSGSGVRGRYGAKASFEAWAGRKYPSGQYVRQYHPRNATTLESFGASRRTATPGQLAARDSNRVVGRGLYNIDRALTGLTDVGVNAARRAMKPVSRRIMTGQAKPVRQLYYGAGRAVSGPTAKKAYSKVLRRTAQGYVMGGLPGAAAGAGSAVASFIDDKMKRRRVTGRGMYSTAGAPFRNHSTKIVKGNLHGVGVAKFGSSRHDFGGCMYENQEFYQTVYAPKADASGQIPFSSFSIDVQPGTMSPMLSQLAVNFKFYQFVTCVFHFETLLDGAALQSSTGQVGSIYMHAHTDSLNADFRSAGEFMHQTYANNARVTEGLTCGVECDPAMLKGLDNSGYNKVRFAAVTGAAINDYDQGRVQVALDGLNPELAGRPIGRIRISYKVELVKNELTTALGRATEADRFSRSDAGATYVTNENFSTWGYSSVTDRPMIAHPYNNIGITTTPMFKANARVGMTNMIFPSNLEGLFKVSLKIFCSNAATGDVQSANADTLSNLLLGGQIKTNNATGGKAAGAGIVTYGNSEIVPIIGSPVQIDSKTSAEISSMIRSSKFGGLVVQKGTTPDGTWTLDPSDMVATLDGTAIDGVPYFLEAYNQITVTADATAQSSDIFVGDCITGYLEFYVRLQAAQSGVQNSLGLFDGWNYRPVNGSPADIIDWSIERADDHDHYADVYAGLSL